MLSCTYKLSNTSTSQLLVGFHRSGCASTPMESRYLPFLLEPEDTDTCLEGENG